MIHGVVLSGWFQSVFTHERRTTGGDTLHSPCDGEGPLFARQRFAQAHRGGDLPSALNTNNHVGIGRSRPHHRRENICRDRVEPEIDSAPAILTDFNNYRKTTGARQFGAVCSVQCITSFHEVEGVTDSDNDFTNCK